MASKAACAAPLAFPPPAASPSAGAGAAAASPSPFPRGLRAFSLSVGGEGHPTPILINSETGDQIIFDKLGCELLS